MKRPPMTKLPPDTRFELRVLPNGTHLAPAKDTDVWTQVGIIGKSPHDGWMREVVPMLEPGCHVLDCGAFIGDHSREFVDLGFKVTAFEPMMDNFICLCYNSPNSWNINAPVGDGGKVQFVTPPKLSNYGMRYGLSQDGGILSVRLDDYDFEEVRLIKMDIEGMEYCALQGAQETIRKFKPIMLIESNDEALARNRLKRADLKNRLMEFGCNMKQMGHPPVMDWLCWWGYNPHVFPARPGEDEPYENK